MEYDFSKMTDRELDNYLNALSNEIERRRDCRIKVAERHFYEAARILYGECPDYGFPLLDRDIGPDPLTLEDLLDSAGEL